MCIRTSINELKVNYRQEAFWQACGLARRGAKQRETLPAVANAFAQHSVTVKVAMAAFTGRYSLCRFSTSLIKIWWDDGSHKVGFNRFALYGCTRNTCNY